MKRCVWGPQAMFTAEQVAVGAILFASTRLFEKSLFGFPQPWFTTAGGTEGTVFRLLRKQYIFPFLRKQYLSFVVFFEHRQYSLIFNKHLSNVGQCLNNVSGGGGPLPSP